ncbi:EF-hand domain-containing protein [Sphingomonas alba]|uniref:EF-hand domain-containing protein n=1 Tax=Sphingomonas alba TaxID=2908208 RepID=A0ABT0RML8_9SPHN|nr:EF-hand domain-containing protein [Sphingomonas alba]MCL6683881.1 hypothetical protein [Sphingomonas alba]
MRQVLALSLLGMALPAATQPPDHPQFSPRTPVYLSLMGEPLEGDAGGGSPVTKWIAQADTDGDGAVNRTELLRDAERFFHRLDTNGDGVIDSDEMGNYENVIAPAQVRMAGGIRPISEARHAVVDYADDGDGDGVQRQGTGETGLFGDATAVPEPVAMADINIDRSVSLDEFRAAARKRFTQHDLNGDNKLTADELAPARAPDRGRHAHGTH